MTRALSIVTISLLIAFAFTAYTTKKTTKRPAAIYWCFDVNLGVGLPCRYVKSERAV
jgi:hypothetical protein